MASCRRYWNNLQNKVWIGGYDSDEDLSMLKSAENDQATTDSLREIFCLSGFSGFVIFIKKSCMIVTLFR